MNVKKTKSSKKIVLKITMSMTHAPMTRKSLFVRIGALLEETVHFALHPLISASPAVQEVDLPLATDGGGESSPFFPEVVEDPGRGQSS